MPINLADFERGAPFTGDFSSALGALHERLALAQTAQIVHQRRAIIVIEGQEGAGKRGLLKLLGAAFDPCHYDVHYVSPDRRQSSDGHWLARFWSKLPSAGDSAVFSHSWYRRVLEDRVLGLVSDKEWKRGFDEINEFEAQQRDYGTLLVKLYLHATDATLDARIAERTADPWARHRLGAEELRTLAGRQAYRHALEQMFKLTHTRWAPWTVIDANELKAAELAGLTAIVEAMERGIPLQPPEEAEKVVDFPENAGKLSPA